MSDETTIRELKQRIDYMEKATALQALEYERRLAELNGAHAYEREQQAKYVLQETFDNFKKGIDTQLRELQSFKDNIQGRIIGYSAIGFVVTTTVTVVLFFIVK